MPHLPARHITLAVALCLGAPCAAGGQAPGAAGELRLRPGDGVRVVVNDEPDLGGEFQVDAEGLVLLPRIGQVIVADRPFNEVRAELEAAYGRELIGGVVQITPLKRVAVLGEVRQPGLFAVDPTHSFSDLLALAGGLTPSADRNRITIIRGDARLPAGAGRGGDLPTVVLASGDQVFVGRRSWYDEHAGILISAAASIATAAVTSLIIR